MADPNRSPLPDLERALADLGGHVSYPPAPDIALSVRALTRRRTVASPFWS